MQDNALSPQAALKYEVEVQEDGRVEFSVPFMPGTHVVVFVIGEQDTIAAAESSLDFWDNALDDEDWNNV